MARNSVRTSPKMASKASKALTSGKTSKATKSLAASASASYTGPPPAVPRTMA